MPSRRPVETNLYFNKVLKHYLSLKLCLLGAPWARFLFQKDAKTYDCLQNHAFWALSRPNLYFRHEFKLIGDFETMPSGRSVGPKFYFEKVQQLVFVFKSMPSGRLTSRQNLYFRNEIKLTFWVLRGPKFLFRKSAKTCNDLQNHAFWALHWPKLRFRKGAETYTCLQNHAFGALLGPKLRFQKGAKTENVF